MATIEYAIVTAAVILALVAMQVFLRRAICYKWKDAADTAFGSGRQYEPTVTTVTQN